MLNWDGLLCCFFRSFTIDRFSVDLFSIGSRFMRCTYKAVVGGNRYIVASWNYTLSLLSRRGEFAERRFLLRTIAVGAQYPVISLGYGADCPSE